jgi:hypothetical protein
VGAKNEKTEQELEGKLPPFSWFFFCCFLVCFIFSVFEKKKMKAMCRHLLLWWCSNEEGNGNLLPLLPSLVVLRFNLVVFGCL